MTTAHKIPPNRSFRADAASRRGSIPAFVG